MKDAPRNKNPKLQKLSIKKISYLIILTSLSIPIFLLLLIFIEIFFHLFAEKLPNTISLIGSHHLHLSLPPPKKLESKGWPYSFQPGVYLSKIEQIRQARLTAEECQRNSCKQERTPGAHHLTRVRNNEKIFSATYTIEKNLRRHTPNSVENSKYTIIGLGCSYTFGEGVEDDQTFLSWLAKLFAPIKTVNLGVSSYGLNSHIRDFETGKISHTDGLKGEKAILVYTFVSGQLTRWQCSIRSFSNGVYHIPAMDCRNRPLYSLNAQHKLEYLGTHKEIHPILMKALSWLGYLYFPQYLDLNYPKATENDMDAMIEGLDLIKKKYLKNYSEVYVAFVLYPDLANAKLKKFKFIKKYVQEKGFLFFDYSNYDLKTALNGKDTIPKDGHPTHLAQEYYARLLADDLQKAFPDLKQVKPAIK